MEKYQNHIFSARSTAHSEIKYLLKKVNQTNNIGHLDKWNYTVEINTPSIRLINVRGVE